MNTNARRQCHDSERPPLIAEGRVTCNQARCRDHFQLTMEVNAFDPAGPGQFVHLGPLNSPGGMPSPPQAGMPVLRRAFSIAGLSRTRDGCAIDVIHRVVGKGTRWLASLGTGDRISVMGPIGNRFPIVERKPQAWLVAGGVGLPPMLWLAGALQTAGKKTIAFCGARSGDLLPLALDAACPPSPDASHAGPCAIDFARRGAGTVISTDDGSLGFRGHVGDAITAYGTAVPFSHGDLVVYTCGPEPLMHFVADFCARRKIECYACLERAMACGTGMCQSCVVPIRDAKDADGWRYQLCCMNGPVFRADEVLWDSCRVS